MNAFAAVIAIKPCPPFAFRLRYLDAARNACSAFALLSAHAVTVRQKSNIIVESISILLLSNGTTRTAAGGC